MMIWWRVSDEIIGLPFLWVVFCWNDDVKILLDKNGDWIIQQHGNLDTCWRQQYECECQPSICIMNERQDSHILLLRNVLMMWCLRKNCIIMSLIHSSMKESLQHWKNFVVVVVFQDWTADDDKNVDNPTTLLRWVRKRRKKGHARCWKSCVRRYCVTISIPWTQDF